MPLFPSGREVLLGGGRVMGAEGMSFLESGIGFLPPRRGLSVTGRRLDVVSRCEGWSNRGI